MNLSLDLAPGDGADVGLSNGLASPMGGKHQRDLSLSAKWASNKALALEYLKRQREAILWIESVLDRKLPTRDLFEALKSGIVLRELIVKLYPEPTQCRSPISRRYSLTMAPWKERENITVFLKHCKSMGMNDCFLFCTDDLYEGTNMVQVLFSVQHFMAFSQERSSHLFKPIVQEAVTFSNQELEMAMSKIEQAGGVDVNALLSSAPSSTEPSPVKDQVQQYDEESSETPTPTTTSSEPNSDHAEEQTDSNEELALVGACNVSAKMDDEPEQDEQTDVDDVKALEVLQSELEDHENNNRHEKEHDSVEESVEDAVYDLEERVTAEVVCDRTEQDCPCEIEEDDHSDHDLEAESRLPTFENEEADTEDTKVFGTDAEGDMRDDIADIVSAEIDESILLLEIVEELLDLTEVNALSAEGAAIDICELLTPEDVEITRIDSAATSELTDKHETYVGDSLAPTVIDTQAAAETDTPANRFARASQASKKASKRASKAGKGKKREASDEQLDAEAMSKCTCGSKCSIM